MTGLTFGKYRILERIGRGGMGTVYRAVDETLQRDVAVKVLNPELNDPDVATRFRNEAVTVARANHPGIATVFELFQHESQLFMVMEFVRGETLEALVNRAGALPIAQAVQMCMQALSALSHAHRLGIIHRDLKPANLMITEGGTIKIMDFGIARLAGTEHLTVSGYMMGTPAYMAPEQVLGKPVDTRVDLYAMGVVLYRLATGRLPFKGDTAFLMAQSQVNDAPTPLRVVREGIPAWLDPVMDRALAKNPDSRFQTADEFRGSLERYSGGAPAEAPVVVPPAPDYLMTTPPGTLPVMNPTASGRVPTGSVAVTPSRSQRVAVGPPSTASIPTGADAFSSDAPTAFVPMSTPAPPPMPSVPASPITSGPVPRAAAQVPKSDTVMLKKGHLAWGGVAVAAVLVAAIGVAIFMALPSRAPETPPAETVVTPAPIDTTAATTPAPEAPTDPAVSPDATNATSAVPPPIIPPPVVSPSISAPPSAAAKTPPTTTPSGATASSGKPASPTVAPTSPGSPPATPPGTATPKVEPLPSTEVVKIPTPPTVSRPAPPVHPLLAFNDVRLLQVTGTRGREQEILLNLTDDRIAAVATQLGTVIKSMPYTSVVHATYSRGDDPRWQPGPSAPPDKLDAPGGIFGRARHWLTLQTSDDYLILRLDDANVARVLAAVELRTGTPVTRIQRQ